MQFCFMCAFDLCVRDIWLCACVCVRVCAVLFYVCFLICVCSQLWCVRVQFCFVCDFVFGACVFVPYARINLFLCVYVCVQFCYVCF